MRLDTCTPQSLRDQIQELQQDSEWTTEVLKEEMKEFGDIHYELGVLDENGEMILSALPEDQEWFYFRLLDYIFQQYDLIHMDEGQLYEGEEYIDTIRNMDLNTLRWLVNLSKLLQYDTREVDDESMDGVRELLAIHLIFLLEDSESDEGDDFDDDDDDDDGGDGFFDDDPQDPPQLYKELPLPLYTSN